MKLDNNNYCIYNKLLLWDFSIKRYQQIIQIIYSTPPPPKKTHQNPDILTFELMPPLIKINCLPVIENWSSVPKGTITTYFFKNLPKIEKKNKKQSWQLGNPGQTRSTTIVCGKYIL